MNKRIYLVTKNNYKSAVIWYKINMENDACINCGAFGVVRAIKFSVQR